MVTGSIHQAVVGFYWTLPVPKADFRNLSPIAEKAAKQSLTIAYQKKMVEDFTLSISGRLVGEVVWLEQRPDAGTPAVREAFQKAADLCRTNSAILAYVRFDVDGYRWRQNWHLFEAIRKSAVETYELPPVPVFMNGQEFHPIAHFQRWKQTVELWQTRGERRQELCRQILIYAAKFLPPRSIPGDYVAAARIINERGLKTLNGRPWEAANLRIFLSNERKKNGA